ncbi:hypothetical protein ACQP2X_35445 [Actinoplanes sp. CA-131856]
MDRSRVIWWVLVGVGVAYALALTVAIYTLDATPGHLVFAVLPAYGVALGLTRRWFKRGSGANGVSQ